MLVLGRVNLPAVGFAHTTWDKKTRQTLRSTQKTQLSQPGNFAKKKYKWFCASKISKVLTWIRIQKGRYKIDIGSTPPATPDSRIIIQQFWGSWTSTRFPVFGGWWIQDDRTEKSEDLRRICFSLWKTKQGTLFFLPGSHKKHPEKKTHGKWHLPKTTVPTATSLDPAIATDSKRRRIPRWKNPRVEDDRWSVCLFLLLTCFCFLRFVWSVFLCCNCPPDKWIEANHTIGIYQIDTLPKTHMTPEMQTNDPSKRVNSSGGWELQGQRSCN